MLVLGEVRTCLLHNSGPLPREAVAQLLALLPGRRVLVADRPVSRAASPELTAGVDCRLATTSGTRARGIGTVTSHAVITGGLVLQGLAKAQVRRSAADRRLAWSTYAGRPGTIDVISKAGAADLAAGYLASTSSATVLDLGSVSEHVIGSIQMRPHLDRVTSLRSRPTWVRWAARIGDSDTPRAEVTIREDVVRTIELTVPAEQLGLAARFCEDFALHDWLLTTLGHIIDQVKQDTTGGRDTIALLTTAVERLLPLWMPGAHVDPAMRTLWDALERRPGFSLQWNAQVAEVRDRIAVQTLQALEYARRSNAEW